MRSRTAFPDRRGPAALLAGALLALAGGGGARAEAPGAVTVLDAAQLEALDPSTLEDLSGLAPNVSIGRTGEGPMTSAITIRGLGDSEAQKGLGPAVGLIVDGVVMGTNTGQLIDPFDVSSVEVDRGPSGVLDGRNTTAGVIRVQRSKPTRRWGLDFDYGFEVGYHADDEKLILNMPVGETAGLKISASHQRRAGYLNNVYTLDGLYGRNELTTGDLQLDWNVTPRLEVNLDVTLTHQDGQGTPLTFGDLAAAQALTPALSAANPGLRFNAYGSPYVPGVTVPLGAFQVANDGVDRNLLASQVFSLDLAYDSPFGRFTSITAYLHEDDDTEQDLDGGCAVSDLGGHPCHVLANPLAAVLQVSRPESDKQVSEDLRFIHDFGRRASLMVGLSYFHSDIAAVALTRNGAPGVPITTPLFRQSSGEATESKSVFAELTVNPTGRMSLTGGVRYIDEGQSFHQAFSRVYDPFMGPADVALVAFSGAKTAGKLLSQFTLDYRLTDSILLYAERSMGFRSGGLAPLATLSESAPGQSNYAPGANHSTFDPETDTAYEVGAKTRFLGDQLTINVAGFINDVYNHQQTETVATPGYGPGANSYVVNLPKVEIKGAELEITLRPRSVPGLTLMGSGGYQDARIVNGLISGAEYPVDLVTGQAGAPGSMVNLTGTTLERAPKANFSVRADYARQIGPGKVDFNLGYRWTDAFAFATYDGVPDIQKAYGLVDVSLGYAKSFYKIMVTAKNITNVLYATNASPALFLHGWGDPRTVVAEIRLRF